PDYREIGRHEMEVVLEEPEDGALVTQEDLPADRADQEAREERRDDEEQEQVLVAAAAERHGVGDGKPDEEVEHRSRPAVQQRVAELDRELAERVGGALRR